jgi:hypothetical protein
MIANLFCCVCEDDVAGCKRQDGVEAQVLSAAVTCSMKGSQAKKSILKCVNPFETDGTLHSILFYSNSSQHFRLFFSLSEVFNRR